jgi:hypothetical protein
MIFLLRYLILRQFCLCKIKFKGKRKLLMRVVYICQLLGSIRATRVAESNGWSSTTSISFYSSWHPLSTYNLVRFGAGSLFIFFLFFFTLIFALLLKKITSTFQFLSLSDLVLVLLIVIFLNWKHYFKQFYLCKIKLKGKKKLLIWVLHMLIAK